MLDLYADHDAFVILHGTDTMDYTGAALPLLLNVFDDLGLARAALSKPVILTGAQLPLFTDTPAGLVLNAGSDALANLTGALSCARLRLPEVAIFFDGRLLRGCRALKVSTTRFAAFDSPHLAPLAERGIGIRRGTVAPLPGPPRPTLRWTRPRPMRRRWPSWTRCRPASTISAWCRSRPCPPITAPPPRCWRSRCARRWTRARPACCWRGSAPAMSPQEMARWRRCWRMRTCPC